VQAAVSSGSRRALVAWLTFWRPLATSGSVHDAMVGHPVKQLRRAAQPQIGALEKEIGFDIKVMRLPGRGLVDERDGSRYIVDPLFNEWLRRSSPRADRPVLEASDES
jgi:hypothetical protein